jgi:hypothetical protein
MKGAAEQLHALRSVPRHRRRRARGRQGGRRATPHGAKRQAPGKSLLGVYPVSLHRNLKKAAQVHAEDAAPAVAAAACAAARASAAAAPQPVRAETLRAAAPAGAGPAAGPVLGACDAAHARAAAYGRGERGC